MSDLCHCDNCGKDTYQSPPVEYEKKKIKVKGGEIEVLATEKLKQQNPFTQKIEEKDVPKRKDLKPRAYKIFLQIGPSEYIIRDFCFDCLQIIKPKLVETWNLLESFDPK
jgi:hypothetical protein